MTRMLRNVITGQMIEMDPAAARVTRLRTRIFAWAELQQQAAAKFPKSFAMMITLTYHHPETWRANDVRKFMAWVKKKVGKRMLGYAWVAELQQRGAIHYHVLVALLNGRKLPKPDKCGAWKHGMTRIEKAETLYYICKYASKGHFQNDAAYPRGARIFAAYAAPCTKQLAAYYKYKCSVYPKWLRDVIDSIGHYTTARREPGGGWKVGEYFVTSPYQIIRFR